VDQATISETGAINTNGHITTNNPSSTGGWIGIGTATPQAAFHVNTRGNLATAAGFLFNFTNTVTLNALRAPNFTFTRNNDPLASGTKNPNDGALPRAGDILGTVQFGTVIGGGNTNMGAIIAKAETNISSTVYPGYFYFMTAHDDGVGGTAYTEKLRITSKGNVGIGTAAPTSILTVANLPVYASNALAISGGLHDGAFFTNGSGGLFVVFGNP
jgi:hypothetical protein